MVEHYCAYVKVTQERKPAYYQTKVESDQIESNFRSTH